MKTNKFCLLAAGIFLLSCSNDSDLLSETNALYDSALRGGAEKAEICHFDSDTGEYKTLSVSSKAIDAHLAHGDYLGSCTTSVIYDFDSCTLEDLVEVVGSSSITQNGLTGCGVELNGVILETPIKYGYGTYEMDAKPLNGVSNQYMRIFGNDDRTYYGIDLDVRPAGTDDAGLGFYINGTLVLNVVGSAQMPVSYPNWYHVRVEVTPDYIGLWLDDTLMYEEYNYGGIVEPNGFWGIASYSQSAFDNLSYTPM